MFIYCWRHNMVYNIRQLLNQHSILWKWRKRLRIFTILSPPCPPPLDLSDRIPRTRCACNWLCACSCCAFTGGPDSSQAPLDFAWRDHCKKKHTSWSLHGFCLMVYHELSCLIAHLVSVDLAKYRRLSPRAHTSIESQLTNGLGHSTATHELRVIYNHWNLSHLS